MEIQISRELYNKVMHWVNKSDDEVSGFGKIIHYPETGVFDVVSVHLLKQTNGRAHTDIDGQSLAKLMFTTKDQPGEMRWWWHSHVNMNVFWSGTDTATIKELASQGWIAATVFNKKNEFRSAIGYKATTDFGQVNEIKDEVPTYIMDAEVDTKAWDEEYDANVQKKSYLSPVSSYRSGASQFGFRQDWDEFDMHDRGDGIPTLITPEANKSLLQKQYEEDKRLERSETYHQGWFGYGAWVESQAAGMKINDYVDLLVSDDVNEITRVTKIIADKFIAEGKTP